MANLSNINNKLIVTDGGNLLVNATANLATYGGITIDNFSDPSIAMKTTGTGGWLWTQYITSSGTNNFSMGVNQSSPYWCVKAGAGMDSPHLVVDSSGDVGIGTITPDAKLTIGDPGGATTRSIQIEGNTSVSGMNGTIGYFSNALYISNNYYYNSAQVHPVSTLGQTNIVQQTSATSGSNFIDFNVSDHTDPNNAPDTRMRILDSGNVGIGTVTPSSFSGYTNLSLKAGSTGNNLDFFNSAGTRIGAIVTDGSDDVILEASGLSRNLIFKTDNAGTFSEKMRIQGNGDVGIGTTTPYSRLDVNGVITNRTASEDPNFTVNVVGMSTIGAGSLQFTQGFGGSSSAGDTVVFRYNAVSWKSWSLDYTFTAANGGLVKGTIGGYNNGGGGGSNGFVKNDTGCTVVATNSGQNVIVTFTANFGIHPMCDMRYSQGGGDGFPRADRASLTFNS